ncbi:MAG TPA: cytochrome c biogenesis protein CcdA, partial [Bacteroidia bacterium]|nr:cytochrome c biogenesis protein CcdA [Bacteroidia bacterium]
MKKVVLLSIAYTLLFSSQLVAQILTPVKWDWKVEPGEKGEYKLVFNAKIDPKWHVYSQFVKEGGPIPTSLTFDANKDIQILGKPTETGGKVHDGYEEMFQMDVKYFENSMTIVQKVKVLKDTKLTGTLQYMVCDDGRCLPPEDLVFEFNLKAGKAGVRIEWDTSRSDNGSKTIAPSSQTPFDSAVQAVIEQNTSPADSTTNATTAAGSDGKFGTPISDCGKEETESKSLLSIILLGFLGGLVALVTPCVFPMIPLTVSFFTKRSENKARGRLDAFLYSFSIVFIYFLLSVPFLLFDISPDTLNEISTGATLNVIFFVVFVIFALSFFGFYEITLPSFIANKADSASNVGGLVGIFFMALTLAIVSFSCTGPILGTLLVGALSSASGKLNLVAGMTSFGLALALPFGIFALFPSLMKSLPKSGGWLNSVKV